MYSTCLNRILRRTKAARLYAAALLLAVLFSLTFSYQCLLYLLIGVGFLISILLLMVVVFSGQIDKYCTFFVLGILLMIVAFLNSDLLTKAVPSLRYLSSIVALIPSSLQTTITLAKRSQGLIPKIVTGVLSPKFKPYSDFLSVVCTTLSNEICSSTRPALTLDMLGLSIDQLIPSQVQAAFLMTVALARMIVTLTANWLALFSLKKA